MTTGEKIAVGRKKLSLTQQQFAERLGVTRQAVSRWESDLAFPETDTLIKMSDMFGCSIDYLLKYSENGENGEDGVKNDAAKDKHGSGNLLERIGLSELPYFEWKSKTRLFGVPLVHVNFGLGRVARGIFSFGLVSVGLVSAGLVSVGLLAFGVLAIGLLAFGSAALGVFALGGVAIGAAMAFGGVAVGCFSFGGCSVGLFACGGYANGFYVAVGDYATGRIAFGKTTAIGKEISVTQENFAELKERAWRLIDGLPAIWKGFGGLCKNFARTVMTLPPE